MNQKEIIFAMGSLNIIERERESILARYKINDLNCSVFSLVNIYDLEKNDAIH
jgi:hypothetical protein